VLTRTERTRSSLINRIEVANGPLCE
jgi:hypothetical protein